MLPRLLSMIQQTLISLPPLSSQEFRLTASDAVAEDRFGVSVALSADGNTAIVGAYQDDVSASNSGSAYIFVFNGTTWEQQNRLTPSDGIANGYFGRAVSISADGNTAIVGAYGDNDKGSYSGSAYVFTRNGTSWSKQAKLVATDGVAADVFGYSVSLSADGNTVAIGAFQDDSYRGSAYIFTRSGNTWSQQAKLYASDRITNDLFGRSLNLSGDGNTLIIGAQTKDDRGTDSGSAYIFIRNNNVWQEQTKLLPEDGSASVLFGYCVATSYDGNTAIVGATGLNASSGAVYVFTRNGITWSQQAKLLASDAAANDQFGYSVSVSADGNTTLISSIHDDDGGDASGSAYLFVRSGSAWLQKGKLLPSDSMASMSFGSSVSMSDSGNTFLIGAYLSDSINLDSGSAYIFTLS